MISEIVPHAVYDSESDLYELHLKVKMEDNFSVRLGGSVSTTSSNQIYLGIGYQNLNYYSKEITFDGQLGKIYNNAQLMGKIDLPTHISTSFRFIASQMLLRHDLLSLPHLPQQVLPHLPANHS